VKLQLFKDAVGHSIVPSAFLLSRLLIICLTPCTEFSSILDSILVWYKALTPRLTSLLWFRKSSSVSFGRNSSSRQSVTAVSLPMASYFTLLLPWIGIFARSYQLLSKESATKKYLDRNIHKIAWKIIQNRDIGPNRKQTVLTFNVKFATMATKSTKHVTKAVFSDHCFLFGYSGVAQRYVW
jgi:hypothetical protein